ncbi:probable tripeptidyl-peptidase SED2 [Trichoderma asperellum]|uniref:tripeptidyl-peptidase II n=1 Tax=Trichoderma asperellum TaxID=101201 RepID=A0A6V8QXP6_TRIAP|nr:probable tripeptidyl-peptidase SED2 [Trichoderma asperellum]
MKASCLLFFGITAQVTANPVKQREETRQPEQIVKLSVALQPKSRQLLEQALDNLSSPSSSRYGQYLGREAAKALLRPRQTSTDAVQRWLSQAGIPAGHILTDEQFVHVQTNAERVEALLGVHYNATRGSQTFAVSSLPQSIQDHVMTIQYAPAHRKTACTVVKANISSPGADPKYHPLDQHLTNARIEWERCKTEITPACLRKLYHVGDYRARHEEKNLVGVAGFDGQAAQYHELGEFLHRFAPYSANLNFSIVSVYGGTSPQGTNFPSSEANQDVQYAVAMGQNVPVRFYATGGRNHDIVPDLDLVDPVNQYLEPYLEFAGHLLNLTDDKLPSVVSISYGANEQLFPKPYAQQVCDMFGQLGTRGVSIIVSSGDFGPGLSCQANDGAKTTKFIPSFPATCPYVTSVGSTQGISPEIAANFSAGGFSDYFARPKWQDEAVGGYLRLHGSEWKGYYNPRGRGFPDVAAQGVNYRFWNHGKSDLTTGTSVSTPVFAALIALLNDNRSKSGLPPMGFLNPWIYSIGNRAFTDITESKSMGCQGESFSGLPSPVIPNAGWNAVEGWDPVSGWGTPLFDKMMSASCGDVYEVES